jgi:lysophospholipase L1-like esterase
MRIQHLSAPLLLTTLCLVIGCAHSPPRLSGGESPAAAAKGDLRVMEPTRADSLQKIGPQDPRFRYEGRIDSTDPSGPVMVWQGSRILIDFSGEQLAVRFAGLEDQSFFDVRVDGTNHVLTVRRDQQHWYTLPEPLNAGRHHLVIFKRSEANAGWARFEGIGIAPNAQAWAPAAAAYALRMEFFGDSITVGACNEDGAADQWEDRRTHNNALSYAAMTARAFDADYRNIAVSGMGIVTGYVEIRAEQIWNRAYPRSSAALADLKSWKPDVVFVNLGENDASFTRGHQQPFPPEFVQKYEDLVRAIRQSCPDAHLVILRGGMYGGAKDATLCDAWTKVVEDLEASDSGISHFIFTHWSNNHPRVADDRMMADELIAWLRDQAFMKPYLGAK